MKTKKILGTLALAALAAACSNEEFEAVGNQSTVPGDRIELGEVTLVMGGADTRFDVGANFNDLKAVVGDKVGACLIDVLNATDNKKEPRYNYDLTSYISTNYGFEYDGSAWYTPAKMVEGNYLFYAPFNAEHVTRNALVAKLNPIQQLSTKEDGSIDELSAIKEMIASGNIMALSHEFLSASSTDNVVRANLKPIYAYPYITLVNNYAPKVGNTLTPTDLVVNQIVIKNRATGFVTEAKIKNFENTGTETIISTDEGAAGHLKNFTYIDTADDDKLKSATGSFIQQANSNPAGATADLMVAAGAKTSAAIIVKAPAGGIELAKNGGKVSFYAIVPAAAYGANLTIEVYTDKGVYTLTPGATDTDNATLVAGKRFPIGEYDGNGNTIQAAEAGDPQAGDAFTANIVAGIGGTKLPSAETSVVATTADLATLIANTPANATLEVAPLNESVGVNATVLNAIKAKANTAFRVVFTAPVTISTSISTNKTVEFRSDAIINSGDITLGQGVKVGKQTTPCNLKVNGGNVTIDGAKFSWTVATGPEAGTYAGAIENNGGDIVVKSDIASLNNVKGTVTMEEPKTGVFTNNGGTITIGDGNYVAGTTNTDKDFSANSVTNNKGTLTVKAHSKLGTVSKNGVASTSEGTIENYGEISVVTENTAKGTINNYGKLANVVKNDGNIYMKNGQSSVKVSADTGTTGRIDNTKDATVDITAAGKQVVYYEFTSDQIGALIPETATYNTIVLKDMTWKPNADQTLKDDVNVELDNATISVYTENLNIVVDGNISVTNTSYMKGAGTSKIYVTGSVTSNTAGTGKDKLYITGIKCYSGATYSGGSWTGTTENGD